MGRCTNFGAKLNPQPTTTNENLEEILPNNFLGRGRGLGFGRGRSGGGGLGRGLGRQNRFRGGN